MSSLGISLIVFACIFGSMLLGRVLRGLLPEHHLSADSKDVVKLGTEMIPTLAALVCRRRTLSDPGAGPSVRGVDQYLQRTAAQRLGTHWAVGG